MNKTIFLLISIIIILGSFSCTDDDSSPEKDCENTVEGPFMDHRDGKIYNSIKIGDQLWMAENLNYDAGNGSYVYDNIESNAEIYGRLYDWEVALDACPDCWHLPSEEEWEELFDFLGGMGVAGGKMKNNDTTYWENPNLGATNSSGFSALPGGLRCIEGCTYFGLGFWGTYWSSTEIDNETAWRFTLHYSSEQIEVMGGDKNVAKSVRCIRD
ncbi:MAG: fibrobacter succinogenes major paralogous domain-containing protein [Cyclobacteriaceae bacterium]|jgi:uncharacterized protein (TIGR02145 family)